MQSDTGLSLPIQLMSARFIFAFFAFDRGLRYVFLKFA